MNTRFLPLLIIVSLVLANAAIAQTVTFSDEEPRGSTHAPIIVPASVFNESTVTTSDVQPAPQLAAPEQVFSQGSGPAVTLRGGWNWLGNVESSSSVIGGVESSPFVRQPSDEVGYGLSVGFSKPSTRRLRTETEFAFRSNDITRRIGSFVAAEVESELESYTAMKNVFIDFENRSRFTPYAGVGIGISFIEMESTRTTFADTGAITDQRETSTNDTAFSYQFIGGVKARITHSSELFAEYRMLGTTDVDLDSFVVPYRANNLFLGFRLNY